MCTVCNEHCFQLPIRVTQCSCIDCRVRYHQWWDPWIKCWLSLPRDTSSALAWMRCLSQPNLTMKVPYMLKSTSLSTFANADGSIWFQSCFVVVVKCDKTAVALRNNSVLNTCYFVNKINVYLLRCSYCQSILNKKSVYEKT